jgi:hypothetical protein
MRRLRRANQKHTIQQAKKRKKLKQRAVSAGTAAMITLGAGVTLNITRAHIPDPHELSVSQDADGDLLADNEEIALAYLTFESDQNRNQIPDGVELAKQSFTDVNDLPIWDPSSGLPEPSETYKKIIAAAFGYEKCAVCGDNVVMMKWEVVNPQNGFSVRFTDMGMHYLENGSFSYHSLDTWSGKGRIDVPALLQSLELRLPCEPNDHQLSVSQDADLDLLDNKEEFAIGYQPFNDDQNKNEISDGIELANRCAAEVNDLPTYPPPDPNQTYKKEHALNGLERCYICGKLIHMGGWEIINPRLGMHYPGPNDPLDKMFLPDLALHYMEHGSFDCYGGVHRGRVDLQRLMAVLECRFPHDPNVHQLPLDANDLDGDLLADDEELSAGYNLYNPDQDQDLTPDGIELAKQCGEVIDALPVHDPYGGNPPPEQTYKVNCFQKGLEQCGICGAMRNMGYWLVINPKLDISIDVPDIVCHYMEHGSFSYAGDVHGKGRIDIVLLVKVLEMPRHCGDLGTMYLPGDLNEDCSENFKDIAEVANRWLECTDPNQQGCDKQ